ncbi:MAG TPA: response regulator [Verrucomicrobiae bacterium]|jgi:two-component system alkaline phosphatase synthesis response regulator PhoP|nr:response regulator [Verrucomicrobiae bacterium]
MNKRILVADDESFMHRLLHHHLSRAGYEVVSVSSGSEAVARAASDAPQLVVMDVMMGGLDGLAALKELKQSDATREIPVILMTASAQITRKQAEESGASAFFTKPFSPTQLLLEVKQLIAKAAN